MILKLEQTSQNDFAGFIMKNEKNYKNSNIVNAS